MKNSKWWGLGWVVFLVFQTFNGWCQNPIVVPLPGRNIIKMLADQSRGRIYALNQSAGGQNGSLLALNATNGALEGEIMLNPTPSDMCIKAREDSLYVVHTGGGERTIVKVNLNSFTKESQRAFATPYTYDANIPLYIAPGRGDYLYVTDGAWVPNIITFSYLTGRTLATTGTGAGNLAVTRDGRHLYYWFQHGWLEGLWSSKLVQTDVYTNESCVILQESRYYLNHDPLGAPLLLDVSERMVFAKTHVVWAANFNSVIRVFDENIYSITFDGRFAFGWTKVYDVSTGAVITNYPVATSVQAVADACKKHFRYDAATGSLAIYSLDYLGDVGGIHPEGSPANGQTISLPLTNLSWTASLFGLAYDVYWGTNAQAVAEADLNSASYLGRTSNNTIRLPQNLEPGRDYYWRLDMLGYSFTNRGPVWSFRTFNLRVQPASLDLEATSLSMSFAQVVRVEGQGTWEAWVQNASWASISVTNGTAPSAFFLDVSPSNMAAGFYTNALWIRSGESLMAVPIKLRVRAFYLTKMIADQQRPFLYALSPPGVNEQQGSLLFIHTESGWVEKMLPIGPNPTDLTINYEEGRLYVGNHGSPEVDVVDLETQKLLAPLVLPTADVYKINAGRRGCVVVEEMDQWVEMILFNTQTGAELARFGAREGDGEFDNSGRYYYHVDNNITGACITKYDTISNSFETVVSNGTTGNYIGSRNLVRSADGSRLVWTRVIFTQDLEALGTLSEEIYCLSTNGRVAFGQNSAYDTEYKLEIHRLPVASSITAVDGNNQYFWYHANETLGRIPLGEICAPKITRQPTNTAALLGSPVYINTSAMGLQPLIYQWYFGGQPLVSQTNSFLSLPVLQAEQAGSYYLVVSNGYGAVTSSVIQVHLLRRPAVLQQPGNTNIYAGRTLMVGLTVDGTPPIACQWYFGNSPLAGATNTTLVISNIQNNAQGLYWATLTNIGGAVTSAPVWVRVLPSLPFFAQQPSSWRGYLGTTANLSVAARGSEPISYYWFFRGASYATTQNVLNVTLGLPLAGDYYVVASNALGTATSEVANIIVDVAPPVFLQQPTGGVALVGGTWTFSASVTGSAPIWYYWRKDGMFLAVSNHPTLRLSPVSASHAGAYQVIASNLAGTATSAVAVLEVHRPLQWASPLTHRRVVEGEDVVIVPSVEGTPPITASWYFNEVELVSTNASLVITNIQRRQAGFYRLVLSNPFSSLTNTIRLFVFPPPGTAVAWGDASGRQAPAPVGLHDVVAVAGGDYHSVALRFDGRVVTWGYNQQGQTSIPANLPRLVAIAAGANHTLGLSEDGKVFAWGANTHKQLNVPSVASSEVVAIRAGSLHNLALLKNGNVVAWGDNSYNQTNVPTTLRNVLDIAAGSFHSLALLTNGTVIAWGYNQSGQTNVPAGATNVTALAAGLAHSAALLADGRVICWGNNDYGQCQPPAEATNLVAIAAGTYHTYALRGDGQVLAWGDNSFGQLDLPGAVCRSRVVGAGFYHGLAVVQRPVLRLMPQADGIRLLWDGPAMLQWAVSPAGPFSDVTGATNEWVVPRDQGARFFRLRR